ncbi:MAG: hypothetical protein QMD36_02580 [Candidatus Aenigmarchaeota archaeon]|nr:hypothetical protein [Candidatus Aenigmarchaeota archaeon]
MFGFGKKEIEIFLEKYNYSPGETIRGRISLKLNKPIHARALKVGLVGEKFVTETVRDSGGSMRSRQKRKNVYSFEMPLDSEKEYLQGEYDFEIKIPTNLLQTSLPEGIISDVIKTYKILTGSESNVFWYVIAKLDVPMKFDVSERIQINIG